MSTIFSKIVRGEIPSYRIAENAEFFAFLDISPIQLGHTLVVPKREVDYFFDLSDEELSRMMVFSKQVAAAIRTAFACQKVALSVVGLEVNHAHVHLIPVNEMGDMTLSHKLSPSPEEMKAICDLIRQSLRTDLL